MVTDKEAQSLTVIPLVRVNFRAAASGCSVALVCVALRR